MLLAVQIVQCVGNLVNIPHGLFHRQALHIRIAHLVRQGASGQVLHDVVNRPVLLEHVADVDDVGVVYVQQVPGYSDELALVLVHLLVAVLCRHGDITSVVASHAPVAHEELLDGNFHLHAHVTLLSRKSGSNLSQVCYAKTSLSQHFVNSVSSVPQRASRP